MNNWTMYTKYLFLNGVSWSHTNPQVEGNPFRKWNGKIIETRGGGYLPRDSFHFWWFFSIRLRGWKKSSFIPTFNILINNLNELKSHFCLINDNIYTLLALVKWTFIYVYIVYRIFLKYMKCFCGIYFLFFIIKI